MIFVLIICIFYAIGTLKKCDKGRVKVHFTKTMRPEGKIILNLSGKIFPKLWIYFHCSEKGFFFEVVIYFLVCVYKGS